MGSVLEVNKAEKAVRPELFLPAKIRNPSAGLLWRRVGKRCSEGLDLKKQGSNLTSAGLDPQFHP